MADDNDDEMPLAAPAPAAKQSPLIPLIVVLIAMPVAAWAIFTFVIAPSMKTTIHDSVVGHSPEDEKQAVEKLKNMQRYEVSELTTNLGGIEPRYIRVSFTLEGSNPNFGELMETARPRVLNAALSVLQSMSVRQAMQGGIKNIVASDMVSAINTALQPAPAVVEKIYFTEFVIQ